MFGEMSPSSSRKIKSLTTASRQLQPEVGQEVEVGMDNVAEDDMAKDEDWKSNKVDNSSSAGSLAGKEIYWTREIAFL